MDYNNGITISVCALLGQNSNKILNTAFMSIMIIWTITSNTYAIFSIGLLTIHVGWKKNLSPHSLNFLLPFQNQYLRQVMSNYYIKTQWGVFLGWRFLCFIWGFLLFVFVFLLKLNYTTCDSQIQRSFINKQPFVFRPHQICLHTFWD